MQVPAALVLLMREASIDLVRRCREVLTPLSLCFEDGYQHQSDDIGALVANQIKWHRSSDATWRLCGNPRTNGGDRILGSLSKVSDESSLTILPWGADATGQMLAIVSNDVSIMKKVNELVDETRCRDLIITTYDANSLREQRFCGMIFKRESTRKGVGMWNYLSMASGMVCALHSDSRKHIERIGLDARRICEAHAEWFGSPIIHAWFEILDEETFSRFANANNTVMVLSGITDKTFCQTALDEFESVANDPLRFVVSDTTAGAAIYIPQTEYERYEIYMRRAWDDTLPKILELLGNEPFYKLKCLF